MKPLDYSRRGVLGGLAGAVAAPYLASTARAATTDVDVVIVGAGAAGIGAALACKANNVRYIVVEAADRIGGRALTDTKSFVGAGGHAVPFDIGCAWIHRYRDGDPFADWSRKLNFDTQAHDLSVTGLYYGRTPYSSLMVKMLGEDEEAIKKLIAKSVEAGEDVAAGTLIKDRRKPMDAASTYMGPMDMAVDFDSMSAADFHAMADYDPNYLVREGYGTLVKAVGLGNSLNIALGSPVTTIDTTGTGVRITTAGRHPGTITAKAAIVTVSTGVLASGAIRFVQPLPAEMQQAIEDVPMGLLAKIPMQIPGVGHYLSGIRPYDNVLQENSGPGDIYFLAWPWDSDLMVGFVGGNFGWELSREGQRAAIDFAKQRLGEIFGSAMPKHVKRALLTPWATDKLALGAYSAAKPGKHASRAVLAQPLWEKLYFAGEATAPDGMFATCSGAYTAGSNAAIAAMRGVHSPIAAP
ncbi:MAG: FAD-dependent oxidoreductase [Proteobacteria bacterium]|nr:FAD-dependent oxidoreductase [Pseudomonadota bacterium]